MINCLVNPVRSLIAFSTRISANTAARAIGASKISYGLVKQGDHLFAR